MKENILNEYPFKFSIVCPVYKAEKFIDEFMDSIINQSIGFENVQLILVDDGSPDKSGEICDKYAAEYPDNILVVHKENGGLSSARNEGLKYIKGRYINFCDPDDTLSLETLENVYNFFITHENETQIVAIPLYFFGTKNGPHPLNHKFSKGSRVINLEKEYTNPQLSSASAFFMHELAKTFNFNGNLVTSEDAEQISKMLVNNHYLGVVSNARYNYRRYDTSLVASAVHKRGGYMDYINLLILEIMNYAEKKLGYIPRFIQYTCMYDLQWKIKQAEKPEVLTDEEYEEYISLLDLAFSRIDDEVIMEQKSISIDFKAFILARKHGVDKFVFQEKKDIFFGKDYRNYHAFSRNTTELSFLKPHRDCYELWVRQTYLNIGEEPEAMYLNINGNRIDEYEHSYSDYQFSLGRVASKRMVSKFFIPKNVLSEKNFIDVHTVVAGSDIVANNVKTGEYLPITAKYKNSYAVLGEYAFYKIGRSLHADRADSDVVAELETKYFAELTKSNNVAAKKSITVRKMLKLFKKLHKKPIWIISDRLNKSGDNGEAFFRYLKSIKFDGAEYYYAISKCEDYNKLKHLGNVIDRNSRKYKLLHLAADTIISSHADEFVVSPFGNYNELYQDLLRNKTFIFLQHGVIKDDLSGWLNKFNKDITGFICSAEPEWKSIYNNPKYYYCEKEVWLTGLPRFDRLYHDEKKQITIMPTWRRYLMDTYDKATGIWQELPGFTSSDYFVFYNSLINSERLLSAAREYGYRICYMPHPNIIPKVGLFDHNPEVKFFGINDEYRKVYAESDLVLTDYSSAVFDFAYLRKPVLYAQFDKEEFFHGEHIYTKGYFDYERDGFGEVTYDLESTIDTIIEYMKNDCKLKDEYRARIDKFFAFDDKNNCKRILDKILEHKNYK